MARKWGVRFGRRSRKLAALGAAVGAALAGGQSAEAGVIYTSANETLSNPGRLTLDLDNNGVSEGEFVLENIFATGGDVKNPIGLQLDFLAGPSTWVMTTGPDDAGADQGEVANLGLGREIGVLENFFLPAVQLPLASLVGDEDPIGPFGGVTPDPFVNGFLGVWWNIPGGSQHFGYAQINVNIGAGPNNPVLTLVDYAFETRTEASILAGAGAPEPGTLGLLALGAVGVTALRRRRAEIEG